MIEHVEQYSDTEMEHALNDKDTLAFYETIVMVRQALQTRHYHPVCRGCHRLCRIPLHRRAVARRTDHLVIVRFKQPSSGRGGKQRNGSPYGKDRLV